MLVNERTHKPISIVSLKYGKFGIKAYNGLFKKKIIEANLTWKFSFSGFMMQINVVLVVDENFRSLLVKLQIWRPSL